MQTRSMFTHLPCDLANAIVQNGRYDVVGDVIDGCWTSELQLDGRWVLGWFLNDLWVKRRVLEVRTEGRVRLRAWV